MQCVILIETQTDVNHPQQNSVATQCIFLNAPPLKSFYKQLHHLTIPLPLKRNQRRLIWSHHLLKAGRLHNRVSMW